MHSHQDHLDSVRLGGEFQEMSRLGLVCFAFRLHFTQADQTNKKMSRSYNGRSFGATETTNDHEENRHKEEEIH